MIRVEFPPLLHRMLDLLNDWDEPPELRYKMLRLEEYKMEPNGQECFTTGELEDCSRV